MILTFFLSHSASPHTVGQWRLPQSFQGFRYDRPAYWEHVARTAERGGIDAVFLSDSYSIYETYRGNGDDTVRFAVQCPRHDPLPLIPIMARVTNNLGVITTLSTAFLPPYWTARQFATLDHLTEGRVGWNIVTSAGEAEARLFGQPFVAHDARYDRAEEYLALCQDLWSSWDADAVVADRASGVYADPARVRRTHFEGRHFRSEGRFTVPRSPQGRPALAQAGASSAGLAFAVRHADVLFGLRHTARGMRDYVGKVAQASALAGRTDGGPKVLWGIVPIVAETEAEARRKQQQIRDNVTVDAGLTMLSAFLNTDLARFDPTQPLPDIGETSGIRSHLSMMSEDFGPDVPLGEIAKVYAAGQGPHIVGTPAQVATQLEALLADGGGHGFMCITHALPTCMDDFVNLLVPELRRRGLRPPDYAQSRLIDRLAAAT
ncbi:MAG: NtaA/DmoA family FMN-dependent monooxygenase [Pseudomonadota bacterium]